MKSLRRHRLTFLRLWMIFIILGSTRALAFTSGQRVQCNGTNVRVRTSTDTGSDANLIGYVNSGDLGYFQSGPVVTGGHNWYYVKWDKYSPAGYTADYVQAAPAAAAPSVSGISPNAVTGSATARTFTVSGASFVSGATVQVGFRDNNYTFTNTSTAATFNASSQLTVPITTGTTADTWNVRVRNPDGQTSNTVTFSVSAPVVSNPAPVVSSLSPSVVTGSSSAQTITVYGSSFVSGTRVQVAYSGNGYSFVNTSANASFINAGQLTVPITTSTQADTWRVRVVNPDAQTSNQASLTVNAPAVSNPAPVLGAINPSSVTGSASPQTFTLTGSSFVNGATVQVAYAGNGYSFINTNTAATFVSSTQLTVPITTSTQADTWQVRVRNADGQTSSAVNLTVTSPPANNPAPVASGISPSSVVGSASPQTFTVTGSHFVSGAKVQVAYKANNYSFVSTSTAATFVSTTQLTVPITTSTQADTWQVRVLNPDAQTSNALNLVVTAPVVTNPVPVVNAISPASVVGSATAQTFTIAGSNFVTGAVVQVAYKGNNYSFVKTNTAATFVSSTQLTVPITTSTQADTWQIRVVNPDTQTSNAVSLTVTAPAAANPAPELAVISPGTVVGSASPQTFALTGSDFISGAVVQVGFAGNNYTFVNTSTAASFVSTTRLTVPITTSTQTDTWNVRVHNPDGQVSNVLTFKVTSAATAAGPTLGGISPSTVTGSTAPHSFVLQGGGFVSGAVVQVAFHDNGYQFQNTTTAATFTSASQLTVPINTGTTVDTWQVRVKNPDGGVSNVVNFQVVAAASQLVISGPSTVGAGGSASYQVLLGTQDVTGTATLVFAQSKPSFATITGSNLFISSAATASTVLLQAQYQSGGGTLISNVFPVAVSVGFSAAFTASAQLSSGSVYTVSLDGTAIGGTSPYTFRWDTNNDGVYDDLVGQHRTYSLTSTGNTYPIGLEATDATGTKAYAKYKLIINKAAVPAEPVMVRPVGGDIGEGTVYDAHSHLFKFDTSRIGNGFVLLTHGLYGSGFDPWIQDMAKRIDTRLTTDRAGKVPNIAIYDWNEYSDPSGQISPYAKAWLRIVSALGDGAALIDASQLGLDAVEDEFFRQQVDSLKPDPLGYLEDFVLDESDFLIDAYYVREIAQSEGISLANWIWGQANAGLIDPAQPVHLIGHSAGGFLIGECALWLQENPLPNGKVVTVDRVTMLDTPFPLYAHLALLPYPGTVERIISSGYGALEYPETAKIQPSAYYRREPLPGFQRRWATDDTGHGLSYRWYARTIEPEGEADGAILDGYGTHGFALSPFLDAASVATRNSILADGRPAANRRTPATANLSDQRALTGFSTFGQVAVNNNVYTLTEQADAGLSETMQIPVGAQALQFKFWFSSPGDGDFLSIRFGDTQPLYVGLDTAISRDGFTSVQAPLTALGGQTGQLIITLVSRGQPNAVLQISDLAILVDNDPDGDGLTNDQEAMYGTDPLKADTDGDGVSDGAEIAAGTNPLDPTSFPAPSVTAPAVQTVTLQAAPSGGGAAAGGGTYLSGALATVTAIPNFGYAFTGWTENGALIDTHAAYTFTVSGDRSLTASFAPAASDFDESLGFDDNQTPAGWTIETAEGAANANASVVNGRFEVRQVDNYVGLQRDKTVPAGATQIKVEYDGNVSANYWGQATQIHLLTTDGSFYRTSIGKSGYGDSSLSIGVQENNAPLLLSKTFPLDTGTYHVTAVFADGQIIYSATKLGASAPLFNEVVSVPDLSIHAVKTVRMYAFTTTGDPSWIDNVSIAAVFPAGAGSVAVTVQGNPANAGTVSGGGSLPVGSAQSVAATALPGWTFSGWNDGGTDNPRRFVLTADGAAFTANFVPQTVPLNLQATPPGSGAVSGGGTFQVGTAQLVSATAAAGWSFAGWSDGVTANPRRVVVPSGGVSYTANFTSVASATPTPDPTPVVDPTPTPMPTPTPDPTPVATPTPTPTPTPVFSPTPLPSPTATPTPGPTPVVTSPATASGYVGVPFAYQITADNHPTGFAVNPLGDGLSVDTTTGLIFGTPTTPGTFLLSVTAANVDGSSPAFPLTLTIEAVASSVSMTTGGTDAATEGGPAGIVIVSRTGDTSQPLTVSYKVKGAAVPGVDYKKLPGTITIPAGATKAKIKVKAIDGSPNAGALTLKFKLLPAADGNYVVETGTVKMKLIGK